MKILMINDNINDEESNILILVVLILIIVMCNIISNILIWK